MSDGQPLAQTLAARMQLGLLGTANTIAHSVRVGRSIAASHRFNSSRSSAIRPR